MYLHGMLQPVVLNYLLIIYVVFGSFTVRQCVNILILNNLRTFSCGELNMLSQ